MYHFRHHKTFYGFLLERHSLFSGKTPSSTKFLSDTLDLLLGSKWNNTLFFWFVKDWLSSMQFEPSGERKVADFLVLHIFPKLFPAFKSIPFGRHTIKTFLGISFLIIARKDKLLRWYVCFSQIRDTTSRFANRRIKFL